MIAIITAIMDGYDTLKPVCPQEGADVDWVCVTDDLDLQLDGWRMVYEVHLDDMHPNRRAKRPKMLPQLYTDATESIWVDASFRVTSPLFALEALFYAGFGLAQFIHPWRNDIYDEADASVDIPKYAGEPIKAQVTAYRNQGMPEHWGLWATGVIARYHRPEILAFGRQWLAENMVWSYQDQLSEAYVLHKLGLRPNALPGTHLANDWLAYEGSDRH